MEEVNFAQSQLKSPTLLDITDISGGNKTPASLHGRNQPQDQPLHLLAGESGIGASLVLEDHPKTQVSTGHIAMRELSDMLEPTLDDLAVQEAESAEQEPPSSEFATSSSLGVGLGGSAQAPSLPTSPARAQAPRRPKRHSIGEPKNLIKRPDGTPRNAWGVASTASRPLGALSPSGAESTHGEFKDSSKNLLT